jgi:glutaredoxin 3
MKNFTVYSKDGCTYCEKIQEVLKLAGLNFVTYKLGKNFDKEGFYSEFGEGATFPQVVLNGQKLGGCSNTVKYLQEKQLV